MDCGLTKGCRLGAWLHAGDSFIAGFFNGAPQVFISEIVGDMPCRRELFEAESVDDFQRFLSMGQAMSTPLSLSASVSFLLNDTWPGPADDVYGNMTADDLFLVISGTSKLVALNFP